MRSGTASKASGTSANSQLSSWIAAKHEWNERYGDLISRAQNWRAAAFLALLLTVIEARALVALTMRSKTVPFIVAVDAIGHVIAAGRGDAQPANEDRVKGGAVYQGGED